ncbi:hypothetical protein [Microbacterium sp. Bi121]|uniref:hypothetical protein n=1 Tax=Microbacterium sp. Bi121 TaxID=2822348 RepID=UPI001DF1DCDE|nr:hypothetical protein [Microbacterium sp. Bi121]CAH0168636.1 hypothetical protein SRABI121_01693 [Microbacterium sp. Bi121]
MSTDAPEELFSEDEGVLYAEQVTPQHGILGFTLRELLIVTAWLIAFVTSFFPVAGGSTLWMQGVSWLLPLGIPTAAVFLLVLRRFSPEGIRRVGSLGIDQFASVAFSVGAVWWLAAVWAEIAIVTQTGVPTRAWLLWVQLAAMLVLVVLTVFAPFIPGIRDDFRGRLITLAHRSANPVRPVAAQPRAERVQPVSEPAAAVAGSDDTSDHTADETLDAEMLDAETSSAETSRADEIIDEDHIDDTTHETVTQPAAESIPLSDHASGGELGAVPELDDDYVPGYLRSSRGETQAADVATADEPFQPFWALAPTERDVFDERGESLFRIGPDAWALVIEDRGGAYVVRHDDGRIGYLHDIADITKG